LTKTSLKACFEIYFETCCKSGQLLAGTTTEFKSKLKQNQFEIWYETCLKSGLNLLE